MSEVTIEWTQRAAGRQVGDVETVELTPFVQGCIDGGKVKVVVDHAAADELGSEFARYADEYEVQAKRPRLNRTAPVDESKYVQLNEASDGDVPAESSQD